MKNVPILTLGEATIPSPLRFNNLRSDVLPSFILNKTRILNSSEINSGTIEDENAKADPIKRNLCIQKSLGYIIPVVGSGFAIPIFGSHALATFQLKKKPAFVSDRRRYAR